MNKRTTGEKIFQVVNYFFLFLLCITMIYPLWSTIIQSFSATASSGGYDLWVKNPSINAYKMLLKDNEIWYAYANTIFRTIVGTVLSVLVTAMFAYPLSRKDMPYKGLFTVLLIVTMLFDAGMIPRYIVYEKLNLLENRLVYILPYAINAYNAIIIRSYFSSLPEAISESAMIDGASELKIFFKIIIPLSLPVLATVALWDAVMHWNTWLDSMLYFNDTTKQVLQMYIQRMLEATTITGRTFEGQENTFTLENMQSATIVISVLPMLIIYPMIQKYFVKGITIGSVKG